MNTETTAAAKAKVPYIVDKQTKKRITYQVDPLNGKTVFSNGIVGFPAMEDITYATLYARAKAAAEQQPATPVITDPTVPAPSAPQAPVDTFPLDPKVIIVGSGSGNLIIDDPENAFLKIAPGVYNYIAINYPEHVVIDATGVSMAKDSNIDIHTPVDLEIFGFEVADHFYRAMNVRGVVQGLHIHDAKFTNVRNAVISFEFDQPYDGTDLTTNLDIRIEKNFFKDCSTSVAMRGGLDFHEGKVTGLTRNLVFKGNTVKDGQGNVISSGACDKFDISENIIDHVNFGFTAENSPTAPNGPHNGIFGITGNGKLYNNKITNHQGNVIRAWGVSYGDAVEVIEITNNIVHNTSKYSAFELQVVPYLQDFAKLWPGVIKWTDAKVHHNTAGDLNTSRDWEGQMLDLYFTGGDLEYHDNLGFNFNRMKDGICIDLELGRAMINMGPTEQKDGNLYFHKWQEAVSDLTTFKSLHPGAGATL
jgi:hypothetical protein